MAKRRQEPESKQRRETSLPRIEPARNALRLVGRVVLWAFVGLVLARGVGAIFSGNAEGARPAQATRAAAPPWPDDSARAFAVQFSPSVRSAVYEPTKATCRAPAGRTREQRCKVFQANQVPEPRLVDRARQRPVVEDVGKIEEGARGRGDRDPEVDGQVAGAQRCASGGGGCRAADGSAVR